MHCVVPCFAHRSTTPCPSRPRAMLDAHSMAPLQSLRINLNVLGNPLLVPPSNANANTAVVALQYRQECMYDLARPRDTHEREHGACAVSAWGRDCLALAPDTSAKFKRQAHSGRGRGRTPSDRGVSAGLMVWPWCVERKAGWHQRNEYVGARVKKNVVVISPDNSVCQFCQCRSNCLVGVRREGWPGRAMIPCCDF